MLKLKISGTERLNTKIRVAFWFIDLFSFPNLKYQFYTTKFSLTILETKIKQISTPYQFTFSLCWQHIQTLYTTNLNMSGKTILPLENVLEVSLVFKYCSWTSENPKISLRLEITNKGLKAFFCIRRETTKDILSC